MHVGPKCSPMRLIRGGGEDFEKKGIRSCDHRGRDWRDVSTSQGKPEATRSWKQQGTDPPPELHREHGLALPLSWFQTSSLQNQKKRLPHERKSWMLEELKNSVSSERRDAKARWADDPRSLCPAERHIASGGLHRGAAWLDLHSEQGRVH